MGIKDKKNKSPRRGRKNAKGAQMNPTRAHLGKVQRAVIKDLLESQLPEHTKCSKNTKLLHGDTGMARKRLFAREFNCPLDARMRQGKLIMVRCFPQAAEKFVNLIESEKEETARKACVDIISLWKNDEAEQCPPKKMLRRKCRNCLRKRPQKSGLFWLKMKPNQKKLLKIRVNLG